MKAVVLDVQREVSVVDYREVPLRQFERKAELAEEVPEAAAAEAAAEASPEGGPPPMPGEDEAGGDWMDEEFEGENTEVFDEGPVEFGELREPWLEAVASLVREGFFDGVNRVITSLPHGKAMVLHLEVPFERAEAVSSILPHLLADELPMPVPSVIYDFHMLGPKGPEAFEALVGVAKRTSVGEFLGDLQEVGVNPAVLGVPELMLRYAADQAVEPGVDAYGLIDFGHSETHLMIVADGRPVVARTVRSAGEHLTDELCRRFRLSGEDAERLKHEKGAVGRAIPAEDPAQVQLGQVLQESLAPIIRDLRRTFQAAYARDQVAVDVIYICGGTSRLRGMEDYLRAEFQVDVRHLNFGETLSFVEVPQARERTPELVQAVGSALQVPLDRPEERLINLRREEFVFRGKSSYLRAQLVRLGAVAAVMLVTVVGILMLQRAQYQAQLQAMQTALAEQSQELFGDALRDPSQVQVRLAGESGPDREFVPRMSAYEVMYRIIEQTSGDRPLKLERIEVDTDRNLVQLVGVTDSPHSVDVLAEEIGQLDCLTNVQKDGVNVQDEQEVRFELQITSRCS